MVRPILHYGITGIATFANVEDTDRNRANGFPAPASLTTLIVKTLCQATLMIACRLNSMLIGQATLNRYRLIRCSCGRIRSRHIQMLSCSHRNFCVCPWLTVVLSTAYRRAGPACHCQCPPPIFSPFLLWPNGWMHASIKMLLGMEV